MGSDVKGLHLGCGAVSTSQTVSQIDIGPAAVDNRVVEALYKEFGALLRKSRSDAHLTQSQVAERVGLTRTSITNIERGSQHCSLHQLYLLASAVGVEPVALLPNQQEALEELLPTTALRALGEDEEGRAFATRVLRNTQTPVPERKAVSK